MRKKKLRTLTPEKRTLKRSGNMFCIKFQVLFKVFSFFPCWNTAIYSSNRCLLGGVFCTPYLHGGLQFRFKDGGQVIVPILLEFTGYD
jgi:hypothetical protein